MAAVTENTQRYTDVFGRTPVEIVNITAANTNTFESQWASIIRVSFDSESNDANVTGMTFSGSTVTFVTSGSVTGVLTVYGNGQ